MELTPGKLYQLSCHNPHISNFVLFQTEEEANELCHSGNIIPITETFMFLRATKASKHYANVRNQGSTDVDGLNQPAGLKRESLETQ